MTFVDSLFARGLISSDAMTNLVQKVGTSGPKPPLDIPTLDVPLVGKPSAIAAPPKGGNVFAARIRDLVRTLPDTAPHEGKVAIGEVYDAYRKAYPRDYQSPKTFGHRLVNAAKAQELGLARVDLPETMNKDLRQRSETPWGDDTVHFVRRPEE